ncbi:MAG: hypothetical protein SGILL_005902 [Bacillariaceae sp.]
MSRRSPLASWNHDESQSNPYSQIRLKHLTEYTKRMLQDYPNAIASDCKSSNYPRVKHDHKIWKFLQQVYREEAHRLHRRNFGVPWSVRHTGMQIPFHVKDDGPRGRSVYAAIDVPEGTKVWNPSKLASFEHPLEIVNFLHRLPHDLQCDVLLWAYPDAENENVGLALDEGTFINHAESDELKNMDSSGYALRDIRAGEEILEDYTEFIGVKTLEWFNIIRSLAWEEEIEASHDSDGSSGTPNTNIHSGYVHAGAPLPSYEYSQTSRFGPEELTLSNPASVHALFFAFLSISILLFSWRRVSSQCSKKKDAKACQ